MKAQTLYGSIIENRHLQCHSRGYFETLGNLLVLNRTHQEHRGLIVDVANRTLPEAQVMGGGYVKMSSLWRN